MTTRKLTAGLFISLDGVVESPDKWTSEHFDEGVGGAIQASMEASDTMLLGRRTYEEWAAYWPSKTAADDPFAAYINNVPKFVVSATLRSVEWRNTTLIGGPSATPANIRDGIARLKGQPGKNIAMSGSGTLVRSLLRDGLLDELNLLLFPIVVGRGKRLFEDTTERIPLKLVDSRAFSKGVVSLTYVPETKQDSGSQDADRKLSAR
jgi:dihydrofolate reductase